MAQNGFTRRTSTATRTYPGTATRLVPLINGLASSSPSSSTSTSASSTTRNNSSSSAGSEPTVFIRPLSRSQLAPVHHVAVGSPSPTSMSMSMSGTTTSGGSQTPPLPPARPISLDQPRPNSERNRNLYLGAPILQQHHNNHNNINSGANGSQLNNSKNRVDSSVTAAEQVRLPSNSRKKTHHLHLHHHNLSNIINSDTSSQASVVTTQPTKRSLLSESIDSNNGGGGGKVNNRLPESSIVCPYCRKCRCEACATPRPLPSRWICSKSILCGPESLLDLLTCLCCVKAIFYHCSKNHEPDGGVMCADDPCSCSPHRKFWRWSCITAMSLLLPPLCLYWPCKGCIMLAEKIYQKYHNNGCNCRSPPGQHSTPSDSHHLRDASVVVIGDGGGSGSGVPIMDHNSDDEHASHHFSHPSVGLTGSGRIGKKLLPSD